MKEVKINKIEIETEGYNPIEITDQGSSIMLRQRDDLIAWPKDAIPALIEKLQQLNTPNQ